MKSLTTNGKENIIYCGIQQNRFSRELKRSKKVEEKTSYFHPGSRESPKKDIVAKTPLAF